MRTVSSEFNLASLMPELSDLPAGSMGNTRTDLRHYLVGGELLKWNGPMRDVISPVAARNGEDYDNVVLGSFPLLDRASALSALAAAVDAYNHGQGEWPTMSLEKRIEHLDRFTRLMIARREDIVQCIQWEVAKGRGDAAKEFDRTVEYIQATVEALKTLENTNSRFERHEGTIAQIRRSPLGVVLCLGPYNYPLNETFTTLIPALIMGNTVVLKPPKLGVLIYGHLLEAFKEAFPPGVVNVIFGRGSDIVPPIMESGDVNVLALIGSSRVADQLKKLHPKSNRLRAVLGLDAKNPAIILPDADIDLAVRECVLGSLSFNGQRCTALKMMLVHRSIAEEFVSKLSAAVGALKMGMPWDDGVQITPIAETSRADYLQECIADAVSKGALVVNPQGGDYAGNLFRPAIVYPVTSNMRLFDEEQFGPVIPVMPFDNAQEALDYVTQSKYGQQVSLFGQDPEVIGSVADCLVNQVCRVNINAQCQRGPDIYPFAGRKDSAEGTLSVSDALRAFSIRTMIATKDNSTSKELLQGILSGGHSSFLHTGFVF